MLQNQNQIKTSADKQQHALKIFFNRIKTGFSEFFGDAFSDEKENMITFKAKKEILHAHEYDENPSDNASFNQNAAITA